MNNKYEYSIRVVYSFFHMNYTALKRRYYLQISSQNLAIAGICLYGFAS